MAKKKNKKKDSKKKDKKKKGAGKKGMKKKNKLKKKAKRKNTQKKVQKKKLKKQKAPTKVKVEQVVAANALLVTEKEAPVEVQIPAEPVVIASVDRSSNYNTKEGLAILRSLTTIEDIESFTEGEKRVTITRAVPGIIKRLEAE
jgi:hypothetical protein